MSNYQQWRKSSHAICNRFISLVGVYCALKILCHLVIGLAFERSENVRFVMVRVTRALCFIHTSYYSVSDFFFSHSNFYLLLYFACVSNAPSCLLPCNMTLSLFMYRSAFYLAISPYSASINTHSHTHTDSFSQTAHAVQSFNMAAIKNLHRCSFYLRSASTGSRQSVFLLLPLIFSCRIALTIATSIHNNTHYFESIFLCHSFAG